ncbi:hypothetical protein ACEPAF_7373 [Sanghuangporus sanghuang]|uniref:Uncharacterized protein n=1 Tax=Sanghuangporus baumii TaxID=108892 RepID=A0A9Q5HVP9_SANBA|nr:hypothetical protein A7U60_g5969 [Sanghuangporus baumii]
MSSIIQLKAKAITDYWRKPPSRDVSDAPKHTSQLSSDAFHKATVTVSASWTRLYDQGGLIILLPTSAGGKRFWVKAGIEFVGGRPNLSVVTAREWADWSLHPLDGDSVTIQIEREPPLESGKGSSLFVYVVKDNQCEELPVREVTWAFEQEGEIEVGVYAARPTKLKEGDEDELVVNFGDIAIG